MATVGLIVHQRRPEAAQAALELSQWLIAAGHEVRMPAEEVAAAGRHGSAPEPGAFGADLDVVVTLGGDGSILRAVELIGTSGVPVLGVDFGRLGYLSEVKPREARFAIERALAGDCLIEDRLLLAMTARLSIGASGRSSVLSCAEAVSSSVEGGGGSVSGRSAKSVGAEAVSSSVEGGGGSVSGRSGTSGGVEAVSSTDTELCQVALNEVFVERGRASNTIRLTVYVDGDVFTTYSADGLIVATPTGSTAYAFSARGPIIDPSHQALLLTPVSPHMLFDRSLVVAPSTRLRIVIDGDRPAVLSVDGRRVAELGDGDSVECTASPHPARFVTFGARPFHQVLKKKFGLNGPIDL